MGIDAKIREFIENLGLEPSPKTQLTRMNSIHPDISGLDTAAVNNPVHPNLAGGTNSDQIPGSAFYKPKPAAAMEGQLPPELRDVPV